MNPLFNLVQSTTLDFTPNHLRLPPIVWAAFTGLNKVHGLWRWYRRMELYRQPDNLAQLVGGHIVKHVLGQSYILRVAGQCLLVATRILECVQQQAAVCQAGRHWMLALKGHYPAPVRVGWEKNVSCTWLSPTTLYWWKYTAKSIWQRIERIAHCTFSLGKHAFKLSMCIMDVMDAFCWSPAVRNEGLDEAFVNMNKWLDAMVKNKEELLAGITDNRRLIERLLQKAPINYEQLHEGVKQTLDKTETVYHGVKKISDYAGDALVDAGKRAIAGVFVVGGLASYQPVGLARNLDRARTPFVPLTSTIRCH